MDIYNRNLTVAKTLSVKPVDRNEIEARAASNAYNQKRQDSNKQSDLKKFFASAYNLQEENNSDTNENFDEDHHLVDIFA